MSIISIDVAQRQVMASHMYVLLTITHVQMLHNVILYEGESISNQPNLFRVEIHLFFFDVIAL